MSVTGVAQSALRQEQFATAVAILNDEPHRAEEALSLLAKAAFFEESQEILLVRRVRLPRCVGFYHHSRCMRRFIRRPSQERTCF